MVGSSFAGMLAVAISAAQLTAEFSPIPGLYLATEILGAIFEICEEVSTNKNLIQHLKFRCYSLLEHVKENGQNLSVTMNAQIKEIESCFEEIKNEIAPLASLGRLAAITRQAEIKLEIQNCHAKLDLCMTKLQLTSMFETHRWMQSFRECELLDRQALEDALSDLDVKTSIAAEASTESAELVRELMKTMQNMMKGQPTGQTHARLGLNLYQIQAQANQLLPEHHLNHGEVQRIGDHPVGGSSAMDVWEGLYLGREKVAVKVVRMLNSTSDSLRRLKREGHIWQQVWELDRGRHILPFYGFCQSEGPYPWMISPWQQNGNALSYVTKNPNVDHKPIVVGIAKGLALLHSLSIIHGDLKAAAIMISQYGTPLITDFGLAKVITDVTGASFTQSHGVSESYRWFAPEVCIGDGLVSFKSDVYSYGMTVLELMTHRHPFNHVKHNTEVVIRTARGEIPRRPTDSDAVNRGLNDNLWRLLIGCWEQDPASRPSIGEILDILTTPERLEA